ncbi:MAG: hypothetical protein ACE14S_06485 [Candidatus Bathyarchaeia archaeon]
MTVTVSKNELKLVLEKLDDVKIELLRLRAMLLPEGEVSEKKRLKQSRRKSKKVKK